ncbi:MAG TPA: Xaa-Pro peptidase family protein [Gaiellaceae bacterium]|nr:Xaa-Pro peptidase family protein [Gaiellaceae bacterium]
MISPEEHADRRARLLEHVQAVGATGYALFDPTYITYFTGFWFLSNERPIVYLQSAGGDDAVFVPEFEVERTRAESAFARIESYPEYPGLEHPMLALARVAADLGLRGTIAADNDGYPGILGYRGPALSEVTGASVPLLADAIEQMLVCKSPAEIELLRESGRWCAHAHRLLEQYTRVGSTEAAASLRAQQETTLAMLAAHGSRGLLGSGDGAKAGFRGQIGRRSAWAHAVAHNIEFQPGDVLVTETGAPVWGYQAELERALVIGQPTDRMRRLFDHMLGSREAAFEAIVPGATCADVDGAVMDYFARHDLQRYWRQHTGHGAGLRNHEAPFLDIGDPTPLEPGMVFTIEPGLYDDDLGGFRHSDTVVVTEGGYELLTDHPADLESLTLPV